MPDSTPLKSSSGALAPLSFKTLAIVFILYLFVSSGIFVQNVLRAVDPADVQIDGSVSSRGEIVRGVFLVVGYILLVHLVDSGVF